MYWIASKWITYHHSFTTSSHSATTSCHIENVQHKSTGFSLLSPGFESRSCLWKVSTMQKQFQTVQYTIKGVLCLFPWLYWSTGRVSSMYVIFSSYVEVGTFSWHYSEIASPPSINWFESVSSMPICVEIKKHVFKLIDSTQNYGKNKQRQDRRTYLEYDQFINGMNE